MKLVKLTTNGFRSLNSVDLTFDPLTVLIGENDAGKSSILDLLDLALNSKQPDDNDYHLHETGEVVDQIEVTLEFQLETDDDEVKTYAINDRLFIKYLYSRKNNGKEVFFRGRTPQNPKLAQDFTKLNATAQKALIQELDPAVDEDQLSNNDKRLKWWNDYRAVAPTVEDWVAVPSRWSVTLPRFERYSAMDYRTPESFITKTLKSVYEQTIYEEVPTEDGTTVRRLIKPLRQVQKDATGHIGQKVLELEEHIKRYHKRIRDINYEPKFEFTNALQPGEFKIDQGRGLRTLAKTGDGTKRRMFMGILDWDRTVSLEQAKKGVYLPSVIRGYDEPDTNLHYEAQRVMYQTILDIVNAENSNIQAILCTHSLTMIDRAPAQSIRLFRLNDAGCTTIDKLETNQDPEVEKFLKELSLELGITNSIMFYERCFILIEGETEESALPILYRRLYDCSPIEHGIRIMSVAGNSAVLQFLKLLKHNRQDILIIFVDKDCQGNPSARLTSCSLKNAGYDDEFIKNRILFIGNKEFEDAFCNQTITHCLQQNCPKCDGCVWTEVEIEALRSESKFSKALQDKIWILSHHSLTKPETGRMLAETCELNNIPQAVQDLFNLARSIVGL